MTLIELAEQIKEIEAKHTNKSNFRLSVSIGTELKPRYSIEHTTQDHKTVNIGYGSTNIKEVLIKFEMAMSAQYRFYNEKQENITDLTL